MTKGAKIAIGCAVAAVAVVVVVVAVVVGLGVWGKGKLESYTGDMKRTEELKQKANANTFVRPEDGLIREDRLLAFLGVRKAVFAIYEKHRTEIEARGKDKDTGFGDVMAMGKILAEASAARAEGQAGAAMSDDEYDFLRESIYKSAWASQVQESTGGKTAEEAARESYEQADRDMEKAASQENLTEEQRQAIASQRETVADNAEQAIQDAAKLDVPPENLALFRKHEQEIKKYAMTGLEWLDI